jgi:hypothetical protein
LAAVVAVLLVSAVAQARAEIVVGPVQSVPGTARLEALACSDSTNCLAVGAGDVPTGASIGSGVLVPIDDGIAGAAEDIGGTIDLRGLACSGPDDCLGGASLIPDGGTGVAGGLVPIHDGLADGAQSVAGISVAAVACPEPGACVVVGSTTLSGDEAGGVVAVTGGSPGSPQPVGGSEFLDAVACATADTCIAVGANSAGHGVAVPITNGTAEAPQPSLADVSQLSGIACAGTATCFAVGADSSGVGVVVTIVDGAVTDVDGIPGSTDLSGIACASTADCVAVGFVNGVGDVLVPITDGVVGAVQDVVTGTIGGALDQIGCSSPSECVAVGVTAAPGTLVQTGAAVAILVSGSVGPPSAAIGAPASGQSYALNDPAAPAFAFACEPAFAGALASTGACSGTVAGLPVTSGQAIDTSHAGTFTLSVAAAQADGQQAVSTRSFTVRKGSDSIFFPQLGPYPYGQGAVGLAATTSSHLPVLYSVVSGPCTVAGSALSFAGVGSCLVRADQPGNSNYLAASATSTITIEPPTPPVCAGLALDVASGQQATIALGCADADADPADPLSFAVDSLPAHGTLTALDGAAGVLTYTPAGGYTGPDSFTFEATDAQGRSSPATISITVSTPPTSVAAPVLSGTAAPGRALRCSTGTWSGTGPLTYARQWRRDGIAVAGRTAATYAVGAGDVGHSLVCTVTATNVVGSASAQSAPVAIRVASNAFTLGRVRSGSNGVITIRLSAPAAGRFRAVATFPATTSGDRSPPRSVRAAGPKLTTYGKASAIVAKAGALTLSIRPTEQARSARRRRPHLKLTVTVVFRPAVGRSRTRTTRLRS